MGQKLDIKKVKEFEEAKRVLYASGEDAQGNTKSFYIRLSSGTEAARYIIDSKYREGRSFVMMKNAVRFYNSL